MVRCVLVGCSQSALVSIYQSGPRKEQWLTGDSVMTSQASLMYVGHVGNEGWPVWSDPTDELPLIKLLKKLMLVLIERCQNTQCITVCCVWGCIATDQSECPCWPLSTAKSANNGHISIRTGPQSNARKWPGLISHIFFYMTWMTGCVCHIPGGTHGTKMYCGRKASRWRLCDALGNVLLGNLGFCHPCGCYFDIYHLPMHCCRPYSLMAVASLGRIMRQPTKQKWFRNGLRSTTMSLRSGLASKFPRSQSNRASVGCAGQTSPIYGGSTSQLTGLKGSAANILVPDTTANFQGSRGVHASMGQGCFGSNKETNTIVGRWS